MRIPVFCKFFLGQKISAVDRFSVSENPKKFAIGWCIGRPREEVVRRGVVRREIPIYGTAGLAAVLQRLAVASGRRFKSAQSCRVAFCPHLWPISARRGHLPQLSPGGSCEPTGVPLVTAGI